MHFGKILLIISYDGTRFFGWQKTKTGPSVQEELEKALGRLLNRPIQTEAASRTDRGVHAQGQAVHFSINEPIDLRRVIRGLNALLPSDIRACSANALDLTFHATLNAVSKEYHYYICNTPFQLPDQRLYSWHIHTPLDLKKMEQGARLFLGTHDFSAFSNERTEDAIRTLSLVNVEVIDQERLCIRLQGNRFLYKMARNIAGTLAAIGSGKIRLEDLGQILASKDRKQAGPTAPAHGLFLMHVFYPPSSFSQQSVL